MREVIPSKYLKYLAYISMAIDHMAIMLNRHAAVSTNVYWTMRGIGRLAFPLFLYFLVMGVTYTKSLPKYVGRIAALAVISEIPYDMFYHRTIPDWTRQNIYFELLVCLIMLAVFKMLPSMFENSVAQPDESQIQEKDNNECFRIDQIDRWTAIYFVSIIITTIVFCFPAKFTHAGYGYKGVIATAFLYLYYQFKTSNSREPIGIPMEQKVEPAPSDYTNGNRNTNTNTNTNTNMNTNTIIELPTIAFVLQITFLACSAAALIINSGKIQIVCIAALPLLFLADDRNQKQSKAMQIFFYLFYPAHLLLITFVESKIF